MVMSFKATSTTAKYVRAFNRWERWAGQFPEVQAFPASPLYISLYLNKLKKESRLKSFIGAAVYGFKWASWRLIRITSYPKTKFITSGWTKGREPFHADKSN